MEKKQAVARLQLSLNQAVENKLLLACCCQLIASDNVVHNEETNYLYWLAANLGFDKHSADSILNENNFKCGEGDLERSLGRLIRKLGKEKCLEFISSFMTIASIDGEVSDEELDYIEAFADVAGVEYDRKLYEISATIFIETYKYRLEEHGISLHKSLSEAATAEIISRAYSEARHYMQFGGSELIINTVNRLEAMNSAQSKGYVAEAVTVAKNNIAEILDQTGYHWELDKAPNSIGGITSEDIQKFDKDGNHIVGFELKFGGNGKDSLEMYLKGSSGESYQEGLMVPDDQLEEARQRLIEINNGSTRHDSETDIKLNASKLKPEDIQGMGVTSEEIIAFQSDPASVSSEVADKLHTIELKESVKAGALTGAAMSGGISAIRNIKAVYNSEKDTGEAVKDIAVDTSKGAIKQAVISAASKRLAHEAGKRGLQTVAKGNVATAIVVGGVEAGGVLVDYAKGDIDGGEAAKAVGNVASTGYGAFAGAEAGAAIGTAILPGVGTVVGGVVGSVAGSTAGSAVYDKASEKLADKKLDFQIEPVKTTAKTSAKAVTGAATGAAVGSVIPVVGTAVGAVVGGLLAGVFG
tara:strand:- start:776 stop:2527 length:1752 start_codon:yes stop_codon:yes gene_type:complete